MNNRLFILAILLVTISAVSVSAQETTEDESIKVQRDDFYIYDNPDYTKTFLFTNCHHWESLHHQLTTVITFLALAKNLSAIPVLPTMHSFSSRETNNISLVGDLIDIDKVRTIQPMMTLRDFLISEEYDQLKQARIGDVPFPADSQEEYETQLKVYGETAETKIKLPMPAEDPEGMRVFCHEFPATLFTSGTTRYVFLDHLHFLHFCTEKHMPWWYDIRYKIEPREEFHYIARSFLKDKTRPMSIVHINDILDISRERPEEDIDSYTRQIVSSLRKYKATSGSLFLMYRRGGKNTERVANLLRSEFEYVYDYSHLSLCADDIGSDSSDSSSQEVKQIMQMDYGPQVLQWAMGSAVDLFVGNIHSPFSRNVCLYRKTHGKPYSTIRGFAELRRVWSWNL